MKAKTTEGLLIRESLNWYALIRGIKWYVTNPSRDWGDWNENKRACFYGPDDVGTVRFVEFVSPVSPYPSALNRAGWGGLM